jgi:feruloyl esterase
VGDSAHWTQLNSFSEHGGKLIFYHGVSDPWFSAQDTVRYYEQMSADNGGPAAVTKWSRLFLVPGMGHCGGGDATLDRFDMLDPIVNWVEGRGARLGDGHGKIIPGPQPAAVPAPTTRVLQGQGRSAERRQLRVPRIDLIAQTKRGIGPGWGVLRSSSMNTSST